jgi:hypothetical protein
MPSLNNRLKRDSEEYLRKKACHTLVTSAEWNDWILPMIQKSLRTEDSTKDGLDRLIELGDKNTHNKAIKSVLNKLNREATSFLTIEVDTDE